ncbi:MAG: GNAT family N-acetyltransferase [Nakamurella sp.]
MKHQLADVAKRGEPLAALWASESLIYGRFGYAPAASRARLSGSSRRL